MSNDQKIEALKSNLAPIIEWYKGVLEEGEPDPSYLYDTTCEKFYDMSRGDLQAIIEVLIAPESGK